MIKNFTENFKRNGKNIKGFILNTEFYINKQTPTFLKRFNRKTETFEPLAGRGWSKYRLNDRFLILSTDHPKIRIMGNRDDYIVSLHVWGTDKSKDSIEINKDFPTEEMAIKFINFIKKRRLKNVS